MSLSLESNKRGNEGPIQSRGNHNSERGIISFSSFFLQGKERLQRSVGILLCECILFQ